MIEGWEWLSVIGIFLEIIGFIFMLRFWNDPFDRHVEEWKKFQKILHPKNFQKYIVDDFNYWRDYKNKSNPSPDGSWLVPKKFAIYWKNMKMFSLFSIIIGLLLQIIQMAD